MSLQTNRDCFRRAKRNPYVARSLATSYEEAILNDTFANHLGECDRQLRGICLLKFSPAGLPNQALIMAEGHLLSN